ncbi:MAG: hypothetical protein ABEJ72_01430, partial [Candidatus Aenigmatarchaeota archaeon]
AGITGVTIFIVSIELSRRNLANFHRVLFFLPVPGIALSLLVSTPEVSSVLALSSIVAFWSIAGYIVLKRLL